MRDMASMHGSYRKVSETVPAVELVGRTLEELDAGAVCWLLDRPVSNSGRLRTVLMALAQRRGWAWAVDVTFDPDATLIAEREALVVSADSAVLDRCAGWFSLGRLVVTRHVPEAAVVDLADAETV